MIKKSSTTKQLVIFTFLFTAGMWLSKVVQPIYFDNHNAVDIFGVEYATMAIIGGFAFVWGKLADRLGGLNTIILGSALYALGLMGRIYTSVIPVIFFSAIAGMGASMVLVGIRPWIRSSVDEDSIPRLIAARNASNQTGVIAGSLFASFVIFFAYSYGVDGARIGLLLAPILVLSGMLYILTNKKYNIKNNYITRSQDESGEKIKYRKLAIKLAFLGIVSGFYFSLVSPYLPLIIKNFGLPSYGATLTITVISLFQILATTYLSKKESLPNHKLLFVIAELFTALLSIACSYLIGESGVFFLIALFILRAVFSTVAATAEETIQFMVIPASATGIIFGISQTAFLIGDAIGGWAGAIIWSSGGASKLLLISGAFTLVNCVMLPMLLTSKKTYREV